jgi:hypothetical protein
MLCRDLHLQPLLLACLTPPPFLIPLLHASALLAFWSGAICLGRGVLWIFFVLSVMSYLCVTLSIAQFTLAQCSATTKRLHNWRYVVAL